MADGSGDVAVGLHCHRKEEFCSLFTSSVWRECRLIFVSTDISELLAMHVVYAVYILRAGLNILFNRVK